MSVPKSKRTMSSVEFMEQAIQLRKHLTLYILSDFGVGGRKLNLTLYVQTQTCLTEEEKATVFNIIDKCESVRFNANYPEWLVNHFRENLLTLLFNMHSNIQNANRIYVTNLSEYQMRRNFQDLAINAVYQVMQELQLLSDLLPETKAHKLGRFISMCNREIALLKGWRKSENQHESKYKQQNSA